MSAHTASSPLASSETAERPSSHGSAFAYVSDGALFLARPGLAPVRVESAFARQVGERAAAIERKHAWKGKGRTGPYRSMVWGLGEQGAGSYQAVAISGMCVDGARVIYAQQSGSVSGVFRIEASDDKPGHNERRLFHTTDLAVQDLGGVEEHGYVVCSLRGDNFASHIAVLHEDGSEVTELTAGDSLDCAPSWVPGRDRVLVYQTTGIQRDAEGRLAGFAPSVIQLLDIAGGELRLALEQPGYDLYAPRVDAHGTLYCLRKKHRPPNQRNLPAMLMRAVTAPFWLLYATIVWLGLFITSYTGRRMLRPGQHEEGADIANGAARARVRPVAPEDAEQAESEEPKEHAEWVLSHELIACKQGGKPEVVARGVLAFDLMEQGILCSSGRVVFVLSERGERKELLRAKQVTALRALDSPPKDLARPGAP
ncbi:MAG: hypothetical protein QM778_06455 [Myxococcales bacterium]